MIVHLLPKSQFTEEFVDFINSHFDRGEQCFVLYTNKQFYIAPRIYEMENVYDYDGYSAAWLYGMLSKADKIILHNLGLYVKELALYFLSPRICKKTIWFVWGSDLYCYRDLRERPAEKFVEYMRAKVIRRFPVIATLTDGDFRLAQEWYGVKAQNVRLDYCEEHTIRLMLQIIEDHEERSDSMVNILLGNSATQTNQHIEALHILERFSGENIKIYAPLSYGDREYAGQVIEEGKHLFGDKFVPVTDYMSREEYYKFLYSIDVGIFNNDRQQGTGNIEALLFYGKKIYIRDDTTMWDEWVKKEGYRLHSISDLNHEEISELVGMTDDEKMVNSGLINRYFDVEERAREWKQLFV